MAHKHKVVFSRIRHHFTLQTKIFLSFSIFFGIVILLGMIYFAAYSVKITNAQIEESFLNSIKKTANSVKIALDEYNHTSRLITDNRVIAKELEQYDTKPIAQQLQSYKRMSDIINSFQSVSGYHVTVTLPEYKRFLNDYNLFFPEEQNTFGDMFLQSDKWLVKDADWYHYMEQPFLEKIHPIYSSNGFNQLLGLITIGVKKEVFVDLLNTLNQIANTQVDMFDSSGTLLLAVDNKGQTDRLYEVNQSDFVLVGYHKRNIMIEGERYLKITQKIEGYDFYLSTVFSQKSLSENFSSVLWDAVAVTSVLIVFILIISYLISRGISTRIKVVIDTMSAYSIGKEFIPIKNEYNDDIGILSNTYNSLVERINTLIDEVYVADVKQKQAQISFLRAQINPHFLYNTLNIINCMALENRPNDTSAVILALADFIHISLTEDKFHSIQYEVQHALSYMTICNYRFDNRIKLMVDIDEALMSIQIPPLTLQPIVENAVLHGISGKTKELNIAITANIFGDTVAIEVTDDGVGMTQEVLDRVNNNINNKEDSSASVGLKNVHQRLKLTYGDDYGINIISSLDCGTSCIITFPF